MCCIWIIENLKTMAMKKGSTGVLAKTEILFQEWNLRSENKANKKQDTCVYISWNTIKIYVNIYTK